MIQSVVWICHIWAIQPIKLMPLSSVYAMTLAAMYSFVHGVGHATWNRGWTLIKDMAFPGFCFKPNTRVPPAWVAMSWCFLLNHMKIQNAHQPRAAVRMPNSMTLEWMAAFSTDLMMLRMPDDEKSYSCQLSSWPTESRHLGSWCKTIGTQLFAKNKCSESNWIKSHGCSTCIFLLLIILLFLFCTSLLFNSCGKAFVPTHSHLICPVMQSFSMTSLCSKIFSVMNVNEYSAFAIGDGNNSF